MRIMIEKKIINRRRGEGYPFGSFEKGFERDLKTGAFFGLHYASCVDDHANISLL